MAKKKAKSAAEEDQPQPKKKTDYNVSAVEFCKTWQSSESAEEVAEKLGMPKPIVHARASTYRQAGVKLKKMPRGVKGIDVEGLNALLAHIDEVAGGPPDPIKKKPASAQRAPEGSSDHPHQSRPRPQESL